jgi:hypothetical protein
MRKLEVEIEYFEERWSYDGNPARGFIKIYHDLSGVLNPLKFQVQYSEIPKYIEMFEESIKYMKNHLERIS